MDESLLEAFRDTAYHVCLDTLTWAIIRIDLPLPVELVAVVGVQPWAFITAWNPRAQRRPAAENLVAQRELLAGVLAHAGVTAFPAIGVGPSGWAEPSLFVVGLDVVALDPLCRGHAQLAYVHGHARGEACLRLLD